ncbi:MAG: histidinol phosphatase [Magnetococcales bacterium]|nr:histidinol phosphatase [Magnetococcales bacterium]MBF0115190.1 histidinol phosphatase [Magnetococcales bacterium]
MPDPNNNPGSRWWKIDFHTHTPASNDYKQRAITPEEWLQHARNAQLDGVVITDHNTGGWIDQLKVVNDRMNHKEGTQPLTLFPGVEITVADSASRVHLLAVFDPSCDSQKITAVLGACGITDNFGDSEATSTTTGFAETVKKIKEAGGVAIPAHIDGNKGLLEHKRTGGMTNEVSKSLTQIYAAEFCQENAFSEADPSLKKAIDRLAKVGGSDAHQPEEIGKHYSWLKMSKLMIEGVRLALSDHQFCVKKQEENPNTLPEIYLKQLSISRMVHCGAIPPNFACTVPLHPHFNAVIGGRGSGKSTLVESIRIVTRREDELGGTLAGNLKKFNCKHNGKEGVMRDDTALFLEIQRRSNLFRLLWRFSGKGAVVEEYKGDKWQQVEQGDLKERFPLRIYSQKQIFDLASNPRGLLEIIDSAPETDRKEWGSRWEITKNRFLELRLQQRKLEKQLTRESTVRAQLGDLDNDIRDYEEKGHGAILQRYQKLSQQKNSLPGTAQFEQLSKNLQKLAAEAALSDFPSHLFSPEDATLPELLSIHDEAAQGMQKVAEELQNLATTVEQLQQQRTSKITASQWSHSVEAGESAYRNLVQEYAAKGHASSLADYGKWVQQRHSLNQELARMEGLRTELNSVQQELIERQRQFENLRHELAEKRRAFLAQVIGSNPYVRMELVPFGDVSNVEENYRSILELGEQFVSSVYSQEEKKGILAPLVEWETKRTPIAELPNLIDRIKTDTRDIAEGKASGNHGAFTNRLTGYLKDEAVKDVKAANFDQLDLWWPEDLLRVKYNKDPNHLEKFEPLEKGSPGQKAAAILAFLLSHGTEPMVIDQPEDDLDNALVYDLIVRQLRANKLRRQLIIITHNPNIVVNGDAELVHVMAYKNGQTQVSHQGGLEEEKTRTEICTIMEGGREAFKKRYERLTLENDHVV